MINHTLLVIYTLLVPLAMLEYLHTNMRIVWWVMECIANTLDDRGF